MPKKERFTAPYVLSFRPTKGDSGKALVALRGSEDIQIRIWDYQTNSLINSAYEYGSVNSFLSADGVHLLDLYDLDGSEISHVFAFAPNGKSRIDLTPNFEGYVLRGLDTCSRGENILITASSAEGIKLIETSIRDPENARIIFQTNNEMITGTLSADGSYAAAETTDHNPGIRRYAISLIEVSTGEKIAELTDGADGPVRLVRFSPLLGDTRILGYSEISGFARPVIWDPIQNEREDFKIEELQGDVFPLDWQPATNRILIVNVKDGIQRLMELDATSGAITDVNHESGAFFEPDVSRTFPVVWSSHYLSNGETVVLRSKSNAPLQMSRIGGDKSFSCSIPDQLPDSILLTSHVVKTSDEIEVQFWLGQCREKNEERKTFIFLHGGPNICVVDQYSPEAQAWLDDGWNFVAINYRGSVTFGKGFREAFWGQAGRGEVLDIASVVDWLIFNEISQPETLYIGGESYGGFLTLMALAKLPEFFKGGFAQVAMCDWVTARNGMNPALLKAVSVFLGGSYEDFPEKWISASPITYVSQIKSQLWLNQGESDSRTPPEQALNFVKAFRQVGGDILLDFFTGGHIAGGLAESEEAHKRMQELAKLSLQNRRWDDLQK